MTVAMRVRSRDDRTAQGSSSAPKETLDAALAPVNARPPEIPGVLLNAVTDADHWLTAGLPAQLPVMLTGSRVFTPLRLDKGTNALRFAGPDRLVAAGYLWRSVRPQIAFKPAVMVQPKARGQVIAFAVDPAFRGMMDGMDVLLANALLFGPALAGPVPPRP
jgi:ribosomal protein S18 acetylase RimI-like enzyme